MTTLTLVDRKDADAEPVRYHEPWRIASAKDGEELEGNIVNAELDAVVDPYGSTVIPEQAYMERIVAAVNACAGLSTKELNSLKAGQLAVLFADYRACERAAGVRR